VYWLEHDLPFIRLVDHKASVLKLARQEVNLLKLGCMPAQVIVVKIGIVHFVHIGHEKSDILGTLKFWDYLFRRAHILDAK
jgi:hypothetical protein